MIIPYNTDAPIYHWPIATVAMILVNIYAFMGPAVSALQSEPERDEAEIVEDMLNNQRFEVEDPYQQAIDPYILRYGVIRPWQ